MKKSAQFQISGCALFCCLLLLWQPLYAESASQWMRLGQGIQKVIDGDTIRLDSGQTVRLIGINTPETAKHGNPAQPLAIEATQQLEKWLSTESVRLEKGTEPHDRHGRLLANLQTRKGDLIETRLVAAGLAWVVAIPPNIQHLPGLTEAENKARKAGRGVWSVKTYQPVAADKTSDKLGFQFVAGRIQRTWSGKQQRYFALHNDMVLVIRHEHWPLFAIAKPNSLVGKTVTARGWLSRHPRYGLRMRITHPFMLGMK